VGSLLNGLQLLTAGTKKPSKVYWLLGLGGFIFKQSKWNGNLNLKDQLTLQWKGSLFREDKFERTFENSSVYKFLRVKKLVQEWRHGGFVLLL